jgi:hypothetical protein
VPVLVTAHRVSPQVSYRLSRLCPGPGAGKVTGSGSGNECRSEWKALLYFADKFGKASFYQFVLEIEKAYLDHWVQAVRKDERYGHIHLDS